ncbi:PQQ-dependent sugar dehydrogenase [Rhodobacteraceae bacterium]|nr:PQQ-dependent sugar dehydrogenase [Paracoccaceae bacterium]
MASTSAVANNAGEIAATPDMPFDLQTVAKFEAPWAIAPMPDETLLISGKSGRLWHVDGASVTEVAGVPQVSYNGQNGFLDVAVAEDFADTGAVYFTYVSPENALVLARARLDSNVLVDIEQLWTQSPGGRGQPGGIIAFGADGFLYLTVGDRMQPDTAQMADNARGKVLRLTRDGAAAPDNPDAAGGGTRAMVWSSGHRNPYGLVFGPDGTLWLHEMGPRGGDELNQIKRGGNYGWPLVSNGRQYSGASIPDHNTRPEFLAPSLWWTPVIAPAGLAWYKGDAFAGWHDTMLIGALAGQGLVQIAGDGQSQINRWDLGFRVRDVAVTDAGAVYILEDGTQGRLMRLIAK